MADMIKVCQFIKAKIENENGESDSYRKIVADITMLTNDLNPALMAAQNQEITALKDLYRKYCKQADLNAGVKLTQSANYAIYYYNGIDHYPAAGKFPGVKTVYADPKIAIAIARQLSLGNSKMKFGVYPVDHNNEISGKAIASYGR